MTENGDKIEGWGFLTEEADQVSSSTISIPNSVRPTRTFTDRIAYLLLEGHLPILALAFLLLSLSAVGAGYVVWGVSLCVAPILGLLFQPLIRGPHSVRVGGLLLAWPLMLMVSSLSSCFARVLEYRLTAGFLHWEVWGVAWQLGLEKLLTPAAVILELAIVLLMALVVARVGHRFPWVQLKKRPSRWAWLPLLVLALFGLVSSGGLLLSSQMSGVEEAWVERIEKVSKQRPYSALPADSDDTTWRDIKADLDARLEKHRSYTVSGDYYWTPDNIKTAVSGLPLKTHITNPPTSIPEVLVVPNCISYISDAYPDQKLTLEFYAMELRYALRPYFLTGDFSWMYEGYLEKLSDVHDGETLSKHLTQLRTMRTNLGRPEDGLEERALYLLTVNPERLTREEELGWRETSELVRPDKGMTSLAYVGNPRPLPLRLLGTEIAYSPTELGLFLQRRKQLSRWVAVSSEIQGLPWTKKMERLKTERDGRRERTVEHTFWQDLLAWEFVPKELSGLKQCELLVLLKLHRAKFGSYPDSLAVFAKQVDFPQELEKVFLWNPGTRILEATDSELKVELPTS